MSSSDLQFMDRLREAYVSNESNQFLLTGNVLDLCSRTSANKIERPDKGDTTTAESDGWIGLTPYLVNRLSQKRRMVVVYNLARGIQFQDEDDRQEAFELFLTLFELPDREQGVESFNSVMRQTASYILPSLLLLRKLCRAATARPASHSMDLAIIIEYAESVLPDQALTAMNDGDRQRLIFFKEWLTDPAFVNSTHLMILVSETASAVNANIRSLPHLIQLNIPLPDEDERLAFIRWRLRADSKLKLKGSQKSFAALSAGMTLLGIEQTMRLAEYKTGSLERHDFLMYLNRLLHNSIGDYIDIVHPTYGLKDVIGCGALKEQLKRLGKAMAADNPQVSPVGILVTGPNGVGKTYVFMAWAGECNRMVIVLKNLRSSFFGETDQIFEKIRNVLEVLGNVIIIVDEADTVFARPGNGTHETEARLFGNVIKMMGDPRNRGKIVWVMMTARPDNLAPDLIRSGRCGLHLPIFDPEGADRDAFIDYALGRVGLKMTFFTPEERTIFMTRTEHLSPADFRELVGELEIEMAISKQKPTPSLVMRVLDDFQPSDIRAQRRLQTLHALRHCSRRSLIPASLADLDPEDAAREIVQLTRRLTG